jgi:hypothetical protein
MRSGNEAHTVLTLGQQADNFAGNLVNAHPSGRNTPVVAYFVVLTVDALQIAMGEKHIANSSLPADNRFFPFVATDSRYGCFGAAPAKPRWLPAAVNLALVRANTTRRIGV